MRCQTSDSDVQLRLISSCSNVCFSPIIPCMGGLKDKKEKNVAAVFGKNLRQVREQNDCSQEQLAEYLGCSKETIQKVERGVTTMKYWRIIRICDLFDVSLDRLFRNFDSSDLTLVPTYVVKLFQDADESEFEVLSNQMLTANQTIKLIRSLKRKLQDQNEE